VAADVACSRNYAEVLATADVVADLLLQHPLLIADALLQHPLPIADALLQRLWLIADATLLLLLAVAMDVACSRNYAEAVAMVDAVVDRLHQHPLLTVAALLQLLWLTADALLQLLWLTVDAASRRNLSLLACSTSSKVAAVEHLLLSPIADAVLQQFLTADATLLSSLAAADLLKSLNADAMVAHVASFPCWIVYAETVSHGLVKAS